MTESDSAPEPGSTGKPGSPAQFRAAVAANPADRPRASAQPGTAAQFRAAVEAGDIAAAVAVFSPDVVFHSPVVHRPYHGKEALHRILAAVSTVFENFRYIAEYTGPDGHLLEFRAEVDGRELQGVDILRGSTDTADRLTELTVLVRPYSAATALKDRMAALLRG